jgi:hypothetical protein
MLGFRSSEVEFAGGEQLGLPQDREAEEVSRAGARCPKAGGAANRIRGGLTWLAAAAVAKDKGVGPTRAATRAAVRQGRRARRGFRSRDIDLWRYA